MKTETITMQVRVRITYDETLPRKAGRKGVLYDLNVGLKEAINTCALFDKADAKMIGQAKEVPNE